MPPSASTGNTGNNNPIMNLIPDSQATQGTSRVKQEDTSMLEDNLDNSITNYVSLTPASTPTRRSLEDVYRDLCLPMNSGDNVGLFRAKVLKHIHNLSDGILHNVYELPFLSLGWSKISREGCKSKRLARISTRVTTRSCFTDLDLVDGLKFLYTVHYLLIHVHHRFSLTLHLSLYLLLDLGAPKMTLKATSNGTNMHHCNVEWPMTPMTGSKSSICLMIEPTNLFSNNQIS